MEGDALVAGFDVRDRAAAHSHLARQVGLAERLFQSLPGVPNAFAEGLVERIH